MTLGSVQCLAQVSPLSTLDFNLINNVFYFSAVSHLSVTHHYAPMIAVKEMESVFPNHQQNSNHVLTEKVGWPCSFQGRNFILIQPKNLNFIAESRSELLFYRSPKHEIEFSLILTRVYFIVSQKLNFYPLIPTRN